MSKYLESFVLKELLYANNRFNPVIYTSREQSFSGNIIGEVNPLAYQRCFNISRKTSILINGLWDSLGAGESCEINPLQTFTGAFEESLTPLQNRFGTFILPQKFEFSELESVVRKSQDRDRTTALPHLALLNCL